MVNLTLLKITHHGPREEKDGLQQLKGLLVLIPTPSTRHSHRKIVHASRLTLLDSVGASFFSLWSLEVFAIIGMGDGELVPTLTYEDLLNIARAWPCLEVLHLFSENEE